MSTAQYPRRKRNRCRHPSVKHQTRGNRRRGHGMNWQPVIAIIGGIALVYAVLLVLLALYARRHPETVGMREALRLLPDLLTLLRRLAADRSLAR
jgi:hypothetical protein